jgi:putative transposase
VAQSTVEKYRVRLCKPPSPTWKRFLKNHVQDLVALDCFTVPTVTFRMLFVLVMLTHERRRVVPFNVTEYPTAHWTAHQVVEACPWNETPRYVLRDRDGIYGAAFRQRVQHMAIKEIVIAPRSPWQHPSVERLIGSMRREVLDHVVILSAQHFQRLFTDYCAYYHHFRTHLSLAMDGPVSRAVEPPECGEAIAIPEVGGLRHRYERWAA